MMLFDYSFLENPEGNDLPWDVTTVLLWLFGPMIYGGITSFLQTYGLDLVWLADMCYIGYVQFIM